MLNCRGFHMQVVFHKADSFLFLNVHVSDLALAVGDRCLRG